MFKLTEIDDLLSNLGEHADFATIAKWEVDLGIQHYQYDIATGETTYFGENGYLVERLTNGLATRVSQEVAPATIEQVATEYVSGQLALAVAVKQLAKAGCQAWTANLKRNVIVFTGDEGKILASVEF